MVFLRQIYIEAGVLVTEVLHVFLWGVGNGMGVPCGSSADV